MADSPNTKLTEALQELSMHQPYNGQAPLSTTVSKQHPPAKSAAAQDLDEVLARYVVQIPLMCILGT